MQPSRRNADAVSLSRETDFSNEMAREVLERNVPVSDGVHRIPNVCHDIGPILSFLCLLKTYDGCPTSVTVEFSLQRESMLQHLTRKVKGNVSVSENVKKVTHNSF